MIFLVGQAYVSRIFRLSRAEASQLWGHSWTWIAELPCAVELRRLEAFKCFSDRGRFFLPLLACFFAMHFKSAFSLLSFYFPSFPLRTFNTFLRLKKVEEERAGVHDFQLLCGTFECRAGSTICATGWLWHLQKPQIYSLTMPNGGGDTGLPWPQLEIVFHQNDRLIARWWIEYVWMHWRGVCEYGLVFWPFGPYKWPFGPYKCPTGYSYTSPQFQSMSFLFGIRVAMFEPGRRSQTHWTLIGLHEPWAHTNAEVWPEDGSVELGSNTLRNVSWLFVKVKNANKACHSQFER